MSVIITANAVTLQVFDCIRTFIRDVGYAPSVREIGQLCFISHTQVVLHLARLEARGYISRTERLPRSIRILYQPAYPKPFTVNCMMLNEFVDLAQQNSISEHVDSLHVMWKFRRVRVLEIMEKPPDLDHFYLKLDGCGQRLIQFGLYTPIFLKWKGEAQVAIWRDEQHQEI